MSEKIEFAYEVSEKIEFAYESLQTLIEELVWDVFTNDEYYLPAKIDDYDLGLTLSNLIKKHVTWSEVTCKLEGICFNVLKEFTPEVKKIVKRLEGEINE